MSCELNLNKVVIQVEHRKKGGDREKYWDWLRRARKGDPLNAWRGCDRELGGGVQNL